MGYEEHKISIRQACKLFDTHCSMYYYKASPRDDEPIREAFSQLAVRHNRWGFWMMYATAQKLERHRQSQTHVPNIHRDEAQSQTEA